MTAQIIPWPSETPTVGLDVVGPALGIGLTVAHELARSGDLPVPVLRLGRKYRVPTAALRSLLGLPTERPAVEVSP